MTAHPILLPVPDESVRTSVADFASILAVARDAASSAYGTRWAEGMVERVAGLACEAADAAELSRNLELGVSWSRESLREGRAELERVFGEALCPRGPEEAIARIDAVMDLLSRRELALLDAAACALDPDDVESLRRELAHLEELRAALPPGADAPSAIAACAAVEALREEFGIGSAEEAGVRLAAIGTALAAAEPAEERARGLAAHLGWSDLSLAEIEEAAEIVRRAASLGRETVLAGRSKATADAVDAALERRDRIAAAVARLEGAFGTRWMLEDAGKLQAAADILAAEDDRRRPRAMEYAGTLGIGPDATKVSSVVNAMALTQRAIADFASRKELADALGPAFRGYASDFGGSPFAEVAAWREFAASVPQRGIPGEVVRILCDASETDLDKLLSYAGVADILAGLGTDVPKAGYASEITEVHLRRKRRIERLLADIDAAAIEGGFAGAAKLAGASRRVTDAERRVASHPSSLALGSPSAGVLDRALSWGRDLRALVPLRSPAPPAVLDATASALERARGRFVEWRAATAALEAFAESAVPQDGSFADIAAALDALASAAHFAEALEPLAVARRRLAEVGALERVRDLVGSGAPLPGWADAVVPQIGIDPSIRASLLAAVEEAVAPAVEDWSEVVVPPVSVQRDLPAEA